MDSGRRYSTCRETNIPINNLQLLEFGLRALSNATHQYTSPHHHIATSPHRHIAIKFVTPAQRYAGEDAEILAARHQVYLKAKLTNPVRWSGETRNWTPVSEVYLNPEKEVDKRHNFQFEATTYLESSEWRALEKGEEILVVPIRLFSNQIIGMKENVDKMANDMYGLSRIDDDRNYAHAWRVCLRRRGKSL